MGFNSVFKGLRNPKKRGLGIVLGSRYFNILYQDPNGGVQKNFNQNKSSTSKDLNMAYLKQ
jgi:hypothetical protein